MTKVSFVGELFYSAADIAVSLRNHGTSPEALLAAQAAGDEAPAGPLDKEFLPTHSPIDAVFVDGELGGTGSQVRFRCPTAQRAGTVAAFAALEPKLNAYSRNALLFTYYESPVVASLGVTSVPLAGTSGEAVDMVGTHFVDSKDIQVWQRHQLYLLSCFLPPLLACLYACGRVFSCCCLSFGFLLGLFAGC
jgi:hypothetical protein